MLKKLSLLVVIGLAITFAGGALAGEKMKTVTLDGTLVCAMCQLHADDAKSCQSVLEVAASEKGAKPAYYYLAKNEATKELGMTCSGDQSAKVTGTVTEKDGKRWIAATKIEAI